jgi:hypothetical protein
MRKVRMQNFLRWRSASWGRLLFVASCVCSCQAQFGIVKGTVRTVSDRPVDGIVRVTPPKSNESVAREILQSSRYKIEHLRYGPYEVIACAGLEYEAGQVSVSVPVDHDVNFVLEPAPRHCVSFRDSGGNIRWGGQVVYLTDRKTGCEGKTWTYSDGDIMIPQGRRLNDYIYTVDDSQVSKGAAGEESRKCQSRRIAKVER